MVEKSLQLIKNPEKCTKEWQILRQKQLLVMSQIFNFLSDLGLDDMDVGIVAIGDRLEDSILATMNLKELGVPYVIVKAKNKTFLKLF